MIKNDNRGDNHDGNDHKNTAELGKHAKSSPRIGDKSKLKDFGQRRKEAPGTIEGNRLNHPMFGGLIQPKNKRGYSENSGQSGTLFGD